MAMRAVQETQKKEIGLQVGDNKFNWLYSIKINKYPSKSTNQ